MPNRSAIPVLLALLLAGYGIWTALYVPAMLVGEPAPLLLIGFLLQVVTALVAAAGLATGQRWATLAIAALAASIVLTQLFEVALGIVPYLRAVLLAVLAIVGAVLLASYVSRSAPAA